MLSQADINNQKNEKNSPSNEVPQEKINNLQEFLEDQCNIFFKELNMPSQSYIIEDNNEQKLNDLRTYDDAQNDPKDNEQIFFCEGVHQYQHQNDEYMDQLDRGKRPRKAQKAYLYSRKHRQKKKQMIKSLQEQNVFMKKKIDQLQSRLRQKQLQLSRIKFSNNQEDYSIQKLNEDIIKKLNLITDCSIGQNLSIEEKQKTEYQKKDKQVQQFIKFYETHGFGGIKTREVLQYYTNEFLENVMRDRQKYHFLICLKKKHLSPIRTHLDIALAEAIPSTEEQRRKGLKFFDRFRPKFEQLKEKCQDFYRSSREVLKVLEKIQETSRKEFAVKIQEAKKPLRTALWFHLNRYRKEMRNLRDEWIDLVKYPEQSWLKGKTIKRKKIKGEGD